MNADENQECLSAFIGVHRRPIMIFFTTPHGRGSDPSHDRTGVITYCTVRLAILLTPPAVAVNVTTPGTRLVVIVNTAEFCPCGMIPKFGYTDAVSNELLCKSTRTPPIPAGPVSVTVACRDGRRSKEHTSELQSR